MIMVIIRRPPHNDTFETDMSIKDHEKTNGFKVTL